LCALLSSAWLVFLLFVLLTSGGNYTLAREDGWPILSVHIFPDDNWLRAILLLFGLPIALLSISVKFIRYALHQLALRKLP
ncbi:MAG TPA: hypothetical protein VJT82_12075, partial [Pyrinomonadaceae bacterium]|nr:hypothetical protein [Pyrinomonadaceae bacterium]